MPRQNSTEHLVFQTAFLGDLLLGIPLFKALRRLKPNDHVVLVCRKGLGAFLLAYGLVDEVIEIDKSDKASWKKARQNLCKRSFDILLCPHESIRSALFISRIRARLKVGYRRSLNGFFFHERIVRPMDLPEAIRQLALLTSIDPDYQNKIESFRRAQSQTGGRSSYTDLVQVPAWADMSIASLKKLREVFLSGQPVSDLVSDNVQKLIEKHNLKSSMKPVAVLAPGSVWRTKMWTHEGFVQVARQLTDSGHHVLIMGAPNEKDVCQRIQAEAPGSISIAGETSIVESAQILAISKFLICNDSGSMHIAAAIGLPTVAIFGPTVLDFGYRPWQDSAKVAQVGESELSCRPCGTHGAKECPIGTHDCMKKVSSEKVLKLLPTTMS